MAEAWTARLRFCRGSGKLRQEWGEFAAKLPLQRQYRQIPARNRQYRGKFLNISFGFEFCIAATSGNFAARAASCGRLKGNRRRNLPFERQDEMGRDRVLAVLGVESGID